MKLSRTTGKPIHCVENVVDQWLKDPKKRAAMKGRPFDLIFFEDHIDYQWTGNMIAKRIGDNVFVRSEEVGRGHIMRDLRRAVWNHGGLKCHYYKGDELDEKSIAKMLTTPYEVWAYLRPKEGAFQESAEEVLAYRKDPMRIYREFLKGEDERIKLIETFSGRKFEDLKLEDWIPPGVRDLIQTLQDPENYAPTTGLGEMIRLLLGYTDKVKGRRPNRLFWMYVKDYEKYGPEIAAMNIAAFDGATQLVKTCN